MYMYVLWPGADIVRWTVWSSPHRRWRARWAIPGSAAESRRLARSSARAGTWDARPCPSRARGRPVVELHRPGGCATAEGQFICMIIDIDIHLSIPISMPISISISIYRERELTLNLQSNRPAVERYQQGGCATARKKKEQNLCVNISIYLSIYLYLYLYIGLTFTPRSNWPAVELHQPAGCATACGGGQFIFMNIGLPKFI